MSQSLAFRTARSHLNSFSDESKVMRDHYDAMDCGDRESILQLGIDSFDWIMRFDQEVRTAVFHGEVKHEQQQEADHALRRLCQDWLRSCELANEWVEIQLERNYALANLDRFRQCHREMTAIVRAFEHDDTESLPSAVARLRDAAIKDCLDGKTAEFVSDAE